MYLKVKEDTNLVRDTRSNAIINTNNDELLAYKARRSRDRLIETVSAEQDTIKKELADIKLLLQALIGQNSK